MPSPVPSCHHSTETTASEKKPVWGGKGREGDAAVPPACRILIPAQSHCHPLPQKTDPRNPVVACLHTRGHAVVCGTTLRAPVTSAGPAWWPREHACGPPAASARRPLWPRFHRCRAPPPRVTRNRSATVSRADSRGPGPTLHPGPPHTPLARRHPLLPHPAQPFEGQRRPALTVVATFLRLGKDTAGAGRSSCISSFLPGLGQWLFSHCLPHHVPTNDHARIQACTLAHTFCSWSRWFPTLLLNPGADFLKWWLSSCFTLQIKAFSLVLLCYFRRQRTSKQPGISPFQHHFQTRSTEDICVLREV